MKICPLITQAFIPDETERELLFGEADVTDIDDAQSAGDEDQENDQDVFMNPENDQQDAEYDPLAMELPIRLLAKSYRGQVACLGGLCRFHDDETNSCRIQNMLEAASGNDSRDDHDLSDITSEIESWREAQQKSSDEISEIKTAVEAWQESRAENTDEHSGIRTEIEKSWEFQQKSTSDMLGLFKELQELTAGFREELMQNLEKRVEEFREMVSSMNEDNKLIIESISDTLAEKTEDIEEKIKSSEEQIEKFKNEVADWKDVLGKNMKALSSGVEDNKKLVNGLSENHSEIVKIMESQKKSFEEEERRRQLSESKRLNNAGVMAYHNGRYEKALELFDKAIELDPGFTEAYNNIGLTYTEMNEEEKATDAFKKAIELNPDLAATYNNLGYAFYRLGSYLEAIEMYTEAIGRSSNNSSAHTNLGNAYYKLDRLEEAIGSWRAAIEIDPSNEKAKRNLKKFNAEVHEGN